MEFEKHEKGRLFNKNLEEKLTSNSNDYLSLNAGSHQERDLGTLTCPLEISGTISQGRGFQANELQGMQQSGLFKAEYVFIVDSEGEDEDTIKRGDQSSSEGKGAGAVRPKSLAISSDLVSDVVRPKTSRPDLQAPAHPEMPHGTAPQQKLGQQYKTKSSYKAFAAIPTNIFLLEQKALDEPVKNESVFRDNALDSPLEYSSEFPSSSPKSLLGSDTIKMPATLPRAAGRETKYANLASPSSTISESQLTKPGVIRPAPVKSKIFLKTDEEFYEPNPFSKYLEEDSDLSSHQQ